MRCTVCKGGTRQDESLYTVWWEGLGTLLACIRCLARRTGGLPPLARTYPHGCRPPDGVTVCGVCRKALWRGQDASVLRVEAEDCPGTPFPQIEPGAYLACPSCVEVFRPKIASRRGMPVAACVGWQLA